MTIVEDDRIASLETRIEALEAEIARIKAQVGEKCVYCGRKLERSETCECWKAAF